MTEPGSEFLERLVESKEPDAATGTLRFIAANLTEGERADFGLELLDAVREEGQGRVGYVIESWLMSVAVRIHPDSAAQRKEWDNLYTSGELFVGADHLADA